MCCNIQTGKANCASNTIVHQKASNISPRKRSSRCTKESTYRDTHPLQRRKLAEVPSKVFFSVQAPNSTKQCSLAKSYWVLFDAFLATIPILTLRLIFASGRLPMPAAYGIYPTPAHVKLVCTWWTWQETCQLQHFRLKQKGFCLKFTAFAESLKERISCCGQAVSELACMR